MSALGSERYGQVETERDEAQQRCRRESTYEHDSLNVKIYSFPSIMLQRGAAILLPAADAILCDIIRTCTSYMAMKTQANTYVALKYRRHTRT